ncbi:protein SCAF11 [Phyllobates terribilis]|uniref:protein SCAF11 n=1 Tax=Phyllobates terribilis TaxID=111132 RepID=UPI003CCB0EE0
MENDSLCSPTTRNEEPEGNDGEENNDGSCANAATLNTAERCPICLNFLTLEVGFPEECCHAFCVSCILKWSETSSSCPVDRKPFQAIYKTDPVGSLTKISVQERRPRENLSCCDQTLKYCTKGKLCFRVCVKDDGGEVVTPKKEKECLDNKDKPEMQIMRMSCSNCITGDIVATCPFTISEATPCFNNRTEKEESEVCLIRRKREALKHLRIPFGADGIQSNSTLPAEILIHPPSPLDQYIFPLSPIPFRSKGSLTRVCAHTGGHDGNEKKQAASGTSTSRGTRKKSVQSSTRRRSTRNSKSDTSNLQSSPKSSSSDHDTSGHNTTNATNTSPSEPSGKQSSKQQKTAPKKGSRTRKRICSATQYQAESKDNDSESEAEQEKKCKLSDENVSETELNKLNPSPNNSLAKDYEHTDMSSPLEHSEEKVLLDSSSANSVKSIDKERATSPDFHNKHQFNEEHSSPPVFKNGQTDLEDSHVDFQKSAIETSGVNSAESQLDIDAKPSLSENLKVSDEDRSSSSPQSEKHIISDTELPPLTCDKVEPCDVEESASSPSSHTKIKSPIKYLPDSPTSEEIEISAENHLHPSPVKLQSNESHFQSVESSSTQCMLPCELVKQCDLDGATTSPDNKEQSIQKPESIENFGPDKSLKSVHKQDELEKVLEVSLQAENQEVCIGAQDAKTSMTSDLNNQYSSESSTLLTEQSEQSLALSKSAEELSNTIDIRETILCKEELRSPTLEDGQINDTDGKTNLKNDHQKTFCDDNNEPVAMECDSLCSDLNDSEVEQSVKITEPAKTETDTLAEKKVSPSKQALPTEDASKKESRTRKSRFHSPSTTWSPSKNDVKDRPRSPSPSKARDSPIKCKSRSPSKDKDGERGHGAQWKGRSRDRHHRRHSRSRSRHSQSRNRLSRSRSKQSRSKSRSRSRSGSRTRYKNRTVTVDRNEKDCGSPPCKERREKDCGSPPWKERREKDCGSPPWKERREKDCGSPPWKERREKNCGSPPWKERREKDCGSPPWKERREKDYGSPPWKERRSNENWRSPWGSEKYRRNEPDKHEHFRNDKYEARDSAEAYPDNKNDYPDWVVERIKSADSRGRGDLWIRGEGRGGGERGWGDPRGRGDRGRGRGDFRGRGESRSRGDRGRGGNRGRGYHWDDGQYGSGDSWNRNVNMDWNSPRSRGGRGRGGFRGGFNYGDQQENNWNNRQPYSGNSAIPVPECSRFLESKNKPKYEDMFDSAVDRSGWSSASSWAVRKTLPADVQNYYSKRGKSTTGSQEGVWPKQEESQDQDQATTDQASQQNESTPVPVNMVQTQMNVVQQPVAAPPQPMNIAPPPQPMNIAPPPQPMNIAPPPQPMNIAPPPQPMNIAPPPQPMNIAPPPQPLNMFPYSVGVHPPLVNIQHNPYNIHPQLPIHLHPTLPLVQMSAPSSVPQGLPPPPPPPPPSQQSSYIAPQQDAKPLQGNPGASYVSNNVNAPLLPAPASVQGTVGVHLGPRSASVATSGYSKNSYTSSIKYITRKESVTVEASADSSKKEKKIQIQERAAHEVKMAIRPYYQNKDITKDEYKEIVKKAVDKVCHSKSGEVDSSKVANLVKAYVDKYKHSRKKGPDDKL